MTAILVLALGLTWISSAFARRLSTAEKRRIEIDPIWEDETEMLARTSWRHRRMLLCG